MDPQVTHIDSYSNFRNSLLKSIRPLPNSIFNACDPVGIQLLTRLRVGLSHLREHKFRHGFNDIVNPFCPCLMEVESVSHFFLRCQNYIIHRNDLMNELSNLDPSFLQLDPNSLTNLLLYGNKTLNDELNSKILHLSMNYIKNTERFDGPLF